MTKRIFVALSAAGQPVAQRTTARSYAAASHEGGSFSAKPSPNHPLRVQEVTKALEWVLTVAMSDGTTVVEKSKAGSFGRTYRVRCKITAPSGDTQERVLHHFNDRAGFDAYAIREGQWAKYEFLADGNGTQSLKNWPQAAA